MAHKQPVIGIDLGGTKISTVLTNRDGTIIARDYRETRAMEGQKAVIGRILDAGSRVIEQASIPPSQVAAVGIGAPGPLDIEAGVVITPPNLPGWDHVPLKQIVQDHLGITTYLDNDANAAALGEYRFGAGQGVQHMIYVTVSTGIGGGLILDGKLYHGDGGIAGEVGHMTVLPNGPRCACGGLGHLEALSSGPAIARQARERVAQGTVTLMTTLAENDPERITAKLVAEAANQGDEEAECVLSEAMDYLGIGMASLVNLLNPQLIVIGGGVANIGERLFQPVRQAIDTLAFPDAAKAVRVVPAQLGNDAGVLGAAAVALSKLD
jgi:glucokinase